MTFSEDHEEMHELISRRLDEDLSDIEGQRLDAHLRTCLPCQRLAYEMNIAITQLRAAVPNRLSADNRSEIDKDLARGRYISTRLPLGQRLVRSFALLTKPFPRFAWGIRALMLIVCVGLVLHSGKAPQGPSRSSSLAKLVSMSGTDIVGEPIWIEGEPTFNQRWSNSDLYDHSRDASTQSDSHSAPKWPIEVIRQSHATKKHSIVKEDELIQTGDSLYIRLLKTDLMEAYVSAFLVAIDGSSRVLIRQKEVLAGDELGPIAIPSTSGMTKLVIAVAKLPIEIRSLAGECRINTSTLWCFSIRLNDETQNSPRTP